MIQTTVEVKPIMELQKTFMKITNIACQEYHNIKDITKEDAIKLYKGHWNRHRIGEINDRRKALL